MPENGMGSVAKSTFALIISGDNMQPEEVTRLLELQPTRIIRKGELINRLPEIHAPADEWTYRIELHNAQGTDVDLDHLLDHLTEKRAELLRLMCYQITPVLHVQSDKAQMSYHLMPETLRRLADLGIPLEISSLSWGEI